MNADLSVVSRRYSGVVHSLRNRYTLSNSRDGNAGQGRPDPNRYTKYLSLRNRKIVGNQYRQGHEEEGNSPNEEASQRALEAMPDVHPWIIYHDRLLAMALCAKNIERIRTNLTILRRSEGAWTVGRVLLGEYQMSFYDEIWQSLSPLYIKSNSK